MVEFNSPDTVEVLEEDTLYIFKDIHFNFDSYTVTAVAESQLLAIKKAMATNKKLQLHIHGHTDSLGSASYNKDLSQKRAQAVVRFLTTKGIAASRVKTYAHGEGQLLELTDSPKAHAINRRVEFMITQKSM